MSLEQRREVPYLLPNGIKHTEFLGAEAFFNKLHDLFRDSVIFELEGVP